MRCAGARWCGRTPHMTQAEIHIDTFRLEPGRHVHLDDWATRGDDWIEGAHDDVKKATKAANQSLRIELAELQEQLHATKHAKVLIVLQGRDTSGKDSTTRRVFGECSPLGVRSAPFSAPSTLERSHDFLWRVHQKAPADGEIVIFNRSHYEDVLIARVEKLVPPARWKPRYESIVDFERHLVMEGTVILKFFLNISRAEQKARLQDRLDIREKNWKWDPSDLEARARWDDYTEAYDEALARTGTDIAPWHVVPADQKWFRDHVVARLVIAALRGLDMTIPPAPPGLDKVTIPD
jgi:PPK2 family polyphosphate:nucleotide phosphotransferase